MNWLPVAQITVSILLIGAVLLQERTSGLGGIMGEESKGGFYQTRRGLEKGLFWATIVLAVLFTTLALLGLVL
ncbi:preprotein translocase subunit SecG [Patescibacteria group bacterium]|nr:preprotein translocase subunit SecG [Patescibacteria group bacterium]